MQINYRFGYLAALLVVCAFGLAAKTPATFTMPSSVLLFANPYVDLRIVTPDRVRVLEPPVKLPVNGGTFHAPSLSPKGDLIAWGLAVANDPLTGHVPGHLGRFALCIYSIADQRWKTYGDFDYIGDSAFSPDGSRIAFVAGDYHHRELLILDRATEKLARVPDPQGILGSTALSWSPDGKELVVAVPRKADEPSLITVLDVNSGNMHSVGEGGIPAWSPTGEWIAYYDWKGQKCLLVHPDGTGTKIVARAGGSFFNPRAFGWGLVWSPSGKQLLLNKVKGDGDFLDVVLVDLETSKSTIKSRNGSPAFGWVSAQK